MKKNFFKVQTISVYISTTLVLLLLGIMGILFIGAISLSRSVQENLLVTVIISDHNTEEETLTLRKALDNDKRVLRSKYISKEQALAEETKALKANPVDILGYNPYEASIELTLKPEFSNAQELEKLEQILIKKKGIKEVIYQKDLVNTINENIQRAGIMLLALLAMLTIISWSLIGNLVRLSIYSKRFILHTMKLVGASWGFICRPFISKNMWIGFFSGILANGLLAGGLYILAQNEPEIVSMLPPTWLAVVAAGVMLFGMAICMLCAFLSVLRFLRMRKNDLYFI
ncbi:MAG: permease-like cell division protein FtsX [Bacteroidaceae bacterium]|nr:permease-like cell division protein FtsX [Bacteroidaceae bacterium]